VTSVCPDTGELGKWIRPHLRYDPSFEHVPPPPSEPVPDDVDHDPNEEHHIHVLDRSAEGSVRKLPARRSSGVYRKPPSKEEAEAQLQVKTTLQRARSSFVNHVKPEAERQAALSAFGSHKFRKSLSAEEVTVVCKQTGEIGKWVRPTIHYDESSEHVPPPPAGPVPADLPPVEDEEHHVHVFDKNARGSIRKVPSRRKSAGVYRSSASDGSKPEVTVGVKASDVQVEGTAQPYDTNYEASNALSAGMAAVKVS